MASSTMALPSLAKQEVSLSGLVPSRHHQQQQPQRRMLQVRATAASNSEQQNEHKKSVGKFAAALAAASILAAVPLEARADVSNLTKCKDSKQFAKREAKEIKKLQSRLKLYAPDSAPALALKSTMERTKRRFAFYGKEGLLCGADGLPHLIVNGDQAHLGEFVYPGLLFLYIAGWIGWWGRSYLIAVRSDKKPTQKEIIIDVPLAVNLLWKGLTWPLAAVSELRNGKLVVDAANITVSPR